MDKKPGGAYRLANPCHDKCKPACMVIWWISCPLKKSCYVLIIMVRICKNVGKLADLGCTKHANLAHTIGCLPSSDIVDCNVESLQNLQVPFGLQSLFTASSCKEQTAYISVSLQLCNALQWLLVAFHPVLGNLLTFSHAWFPRSLISVIACQAPQIHCSILLGLADLLMAQLIVILTRCVPFTKTVDA